MRAWQRMRARQRMRAWGGTGQAAALDRAAIQRRPPMSIQRLETGPRMSQVVVHGDTVFPARVVANNAAGESVTKQAQDIQATMDSHLAKAGTDKSNRLSATNCIT